MRDQIRGLHLAVEYGKNNNSAVSALQPRQEDRISA
jgi:hypothetical protein